MLVELGLVEQRYAAVLEVLDGVPVTEVAEGDLAVTRSRQFALLVGGLFGAVAMGSFAAEQPRPAMAALVGAAFLLLTSPE